MISRYSRSSSGKTPLKKLSTTVAFSFILAVSLAPVPATSAQRISLRQGDRIRVAWGQVTEVQRSDWLFGQVAAPTSQSPISMIPDGRTQSTDVLLDHTSYVERYRGRSAPWLLSGALGATAGGILGGLTLQPWFSNGYGVRDANTAGMATTMGAVVGAAVGFFAAKSFFGKDEWVRVPFVEGFIPMPPLSGRWFGARLSPLRSQRWREFEPSEADFTEFFNRYQDSLTLVEGIYQAVGGNIRFAVVRDERFDGFEFAAVRIANPKEQIGHPSIGQIVMALHMDSQTGELFSRPVGDGRIFWSFRSRSQATGIPEARNFRVRFSLPFLSVDDVGGPVLQWVKIHP